jgi:hypothetical protein
MSQISHPLQAMSNVLIKPNPVFSTLANINNWSWFPFFLINGLTMLSVYVYFSYVDFSWYVDFLIEQSMSDVSPAEQDIFRDSMTKTAVTGFQIFAIPLGAALVNAILAIYVHSMTKNDDSHTRGFSDWFGALWWTQMPSIIGSVVAILAILLFADPQLSPNVLAPLSLVNLLGLQIGSEWYTLLSSVRIEALWSIYLLTVCITQWTDFDTKKSLIIAVAPYVLIFGVWSLYLIF